MKKFFEKKVIDYKFRKAGEGHSLAEEKPKPSTQPVKTQAPRAPLSSSSQAAGSAALARLESQERGRPAGTSLTSKKQASQKSSHLPSEASASPLGGASVVQTPPSATVSVVDTSSNSIVVHVICPICQRSVPHTATYQHFATCLQEEYLKEPLTASVQMIHTLCREQEKRKLCIDTLCRYLGNVLEHQGEEKYRKIRVNNKTFQERVSVVEGAVLFLEAVGFRQQLLTHQDGEEQFYVLPEEKAGSEELTVHRELLTTTQPLKTKVDRNLQVFQPSSRVMHFDLPHEFYNLTVDEIRKEQKSRTDTVEQESVLRTRAMREKEDMRMAVRYYRFVLLRVRMPGGLILQAVFRPLERLLHVRQLLSEALSDPTLTYSLSALGRSLQEEDSSTLAALGLVPSAVLNLSWEGRGPTSDPGLSPELLARIQQL